MTTHALTLDTHRWRYIEERRLRFVAIKRAVGSHVKPGDHLTIQETKRQQPTGWVMDCIVTHVASSLTEPGILDRDYVLLSIGVDEVYLSQHKPETAHD